MTLLVLLAALALAAPPVLPDHLEPCGPDPTLLQLGSAAAVRKAIAKGTLRRDTVLRLVAQPSFDPPWMVSVYVESAGATLELAAGGKPLWLPLDAELAARLGTAWREAIGGVRYPPLDALGPMGFDGTRYGASRWVKGHGHVCGAAWAPDSGQDVPYAVAQLGDALARLARGGDLGRVERALTELEETLHPPPPPAPPVDAATEIRFAPSSEPAPDQAAEDPAPPEAPAASDDEGAP